MKKVFSIVVFLFFCLISFSQKGKEYLLIDSINYSSLSSADKHALDSLLPIYHKATHDTARLKILAAIPELTNDETVWPKYNRLLFSMSKKHLEDTASLSEKEIKTYKKFLGQAFQNFGYEADFLNGDIKKGKEYSEKALALQLQADDKTGAATTLGNIGLTYYESGDIVRSLEYFFKSLKLQEEVHDKNGMGYALNNIATSYLAQGDTSKAMEYMQKSLNCRAETKDKRGYAITLENLAGLFRRQEKIDTALKCFMKGLSIWKELGERQGIGYSYQNLGALYLLLANNKHDSGLAAADSLYPVAMNYFQNALELYEICKFKQGLATVLANMGNCYFAQNNLSRAEEAGMRSLKEAQQVGYTEAIANAARLLYLIYRKENKWSEALKMHELNIQMRDSIFNRETQKSTFKQQAKYEYEKQQALKDAEHQKEQAIAEEEKKRQKIISWSIAVGLVLVAAFAIFISNRLRITHRQKQIIEQQKKIVDQKNKHITDSINYAKRIQDSILPSKTEFEKHFSDYFIFFRPREIVSGDFYWLSSQNEKTILAIADCTGHGVPGAFMSMIGNTLLNEIVNEKNIFQPAEILNHLNEGIIHALHQESRSQDDGMDISVCLFDKEKNKITFAGANHSMYFAHTNLLQEIKGDIYSIGSAFSKKDFSFTQKEMPVPENTTLYFSTDGFSDQVGGVHGKKFLVKQMQELLVRISPLEIKEQEEKIKSAFEEWKGSRAQLDDVLVAGIKI
ncbi:MAG: tetratricopeptide repeat protein [Bacteroidetes bacterium]|nr:tetratricopeptide repeat protein [Bacteroidota bacterium]